MEESHVEPPFSDNASNKSTASRHVLSVRLSEKSSNLSRSSAAKHDKNKESNSKFSRFFRKMIPSKSKKQRCVSPSAEETLLKDFTYSASHKDVERPPDWVSLCVAPILHLHDDFSDNTYIDMEREITEFLLRIEESENNVKDVFIKFIQDKLTENDLTNVLGAHCRLLSEAEKRANVLSNEHWVQQVERYKEEQVHSANTMNTIIRQNRELIKENEALSKKNEKLSATLLIAQDRATSAIVKSGTGRDISSRYLLEDIAKNNDRLRYKMSSTVNQFNDLEEMIRKQQKRSQLLQQQLNSMSGQLQSSKSSLERTKTEHDVQVAKLLNELHNAATLLKETTDNANMITQDLVVLQEQLQPITKTLSWEKLQKCDMSLPELTHFHRTWINKLSCEFIQKQNEINCILNENNNIKFENARIAHLQSEIVTFEQKLDESNANSKDYQFEINSLKEQIAATDRKLISHQNELAKKDADIETKEHHIQEREDVVRNLNDVHYKKEMSQQQLMLEKVANENKALQLQIKGMAQVLTATGAGDIAKELANAQEKLSALQTQYFAIAAENSIMLKQMDSTKSERQTLVAYQKNCYEQMQTLHKDMDTLQKSNDALKEQLNNEKQTITALQNERMRHLEERTILTAIYERLKSEISKVDQLEGAVSTMNKKASKLALIAEYNKQLGEKLQVEVAERDVAINELQNNVKQLNSFQMESTKEKVALCEELNKVFNVKEVLTTKLTAEVEKNYMLDETKKEIQNCASLQLKEIQAAYNREHAALKNLIKDVKELVMERDSLLDMTKEYEKKCVDLSNEHDKLVDCIKNMQAVMKSNEGKVSEVEILLERRTNELEMFKQTNERDVEYMEHKLEMLSSHHDSVVKENASLIASNEYLRTDLYKSRSDLDEARQNELEYRQTCEELRMQFASLINQHQEMQTAFAQIVAQNETYRMNAYSNGDKLNAASEYDEMSQDHMRYESPLTEKFQSSKVKGLPTPKHIENVLDDINARDEEILALQDRVREYDERASELNDLLAALTNNRDEVDNQNKKLQVECERVLNALDQCQRECAKQKNVIAKLEATRITIDEYSEQEMQFNNAIIEIKENYEKECEELRSNVQEMKQEKCQNECRLKNVEENLHKYQATYEKLQKAHKVLALKLFTAVRVLIGEKLSLEKSRKTIEELVKAKNETQQENKANDAQLAECKQHIEFLQNELTKATEENCIIMEDVKAAKEIISDLEGKLITASTSAPAKSDVEQRNTEQEKYIRTIQCQLEQSRKEIEALQQQITNLETASASLEFEKSEAVLKLHELQVNTQAEISRCENLSTIIQRSLAVIIEMKDKGVITITAHNTLLNVFNESI